MRFKRHAGARAAATDGGVAVADRSTGSSVPPHLTAEEREEVHLIATGLAARGKTREEANAYLGHLFGVADYSEFFEGVFPRTPA